MTLQELKQKYGVFIKDAHHDLITGKAKPDGLGGIDETWKDFREYVYRYRNRRSRLLAEKRERRRQEKRRLKK